MDKWPWRSRLIPPIFNTSWKNPTIPVHIWCKIVDSSPNPITSYHIPTSQISQNSKSKWPKWPWSSPPFSIPAESILVLHVWCKFGDSWPWRSRLIPPIFNTSWKNPTIPVHIWCKIVDSSPNPITSYHIPTSQISQNSKSKWPKWPWSSPPFSIPAESILVLHVWCKFGDSSPTLWWVITQTSQIS